MSTRQDLAKVLLAHPGPLPAQARRALLDIADGYGSFTIPRALMRRPDISLDDARRVRGNRAWRDLAVAWLARPEHPLTDLPDLVVAIGKEHNPDGLVDIVTRLLLEPLLRPEAAAHLATCDDPRVTSAVAVAATASAGLRDRAVLRTDALLTPDPDGPPRAYNTTVVSHLRRAFSAAGVDRAVVASWCRQMRTPPLVLAAAASLERHDAATARHAVIAGVQPALRRPVNKILADHIGAVISRAKPHLDAPARIRLAAALREHNTTADHGGLVAFEQLAGDLLRALPTAHAAVDIPLAQLAAADGPGAGHNRAAAAAHLLRHLGDDPEAWRILLANVGAATDSVTIADLLTVVDGVGHIPAPHGTPA